MCLPNKIAVGSQLALIPQIGASMSRLLPSNMLQNAVGQPQRLHKARQQRQAVERRLLLMLDAQVFRAIVALLMIAQ